MSWRRGRPVRERAAGARAAQPATQLYDVDTPAEDSFGFRAEKLLRLAEREAAEMRTRATRDAEAVEAAARRRSEEQLRAAEKEADEIRSTGDRRRRTRSRSRPRRRCRGSAPCTARTKGEMRRLAHLLNAELERPDPEGLTADETSADRRPREAGDEPRGHRETRPARLRGLRHAI